MTGEFQRGAAWTWALVHEFFPEICDHPNWSILKEAYEEGTAMSEGRFVDWTHRVMAEKTDLDERIKRLSVFLLSADSIPVGTTQKNLLVTQLQIMQSYSTVLGARLDDAKG